MQNPVAYRTAARLRAIREQWGALRAAIETPPASAEWPPRETAGFLNTGAADDGPLLVEDRAPFVLRPHPAPANVDALDVAEFVEKCMFELADRIAATVQRPGCDAPSRWVYEDPGAPDARTAAGSRWHGLHWATVYVEGRVMGEQTEVADGVLAPYAPLPEWLLHQAARAARTCEQRIARTLTPEAIARTSPLPAPCPGCGGALVVRAAPAEPPTVTCQTGAACGAGTGRDVHGRRVWEWPACLPLLLTAEQAGGEGPIPRAA